MGALLTEALRQRAFVVKQREQLREERDAAIEAQKQHLNEATEAVHDLGAKLDAALQKAEFWKTSDEAWVDVAGRTMAILGHPNSSDLIGVAEKIVERMAEVEAQRDDAIRERDEAQAKLVEEREAMTSISGELVQAQVKVAKERDEARAEVKTLRLLVESQTEQISHSAMDLYAAVQAEVKAERERDEARAQVRAFQRAAEASVERQRGDAAIYQRDKERERAERAEALLLAREKHRQHKADSTR